jgi:hypothetical protein
MVNSLHDIFH